MTKSETRAYECETGERARCDDDGVYEWKGLQCEKVVEESMREKRKMIKMRKENKNDRDDGSDENNDLTL